MIKYEYIADELYEAGLKPGYIADYLGLGYKNDKINAIIKKEREKKNPKKQPRKKSLYKRFISCMDLSDERTREFAEIIKARKIDYKRWGKLFKKFEVTDSGIIPFLLSMKDFSEDYDFFAAKKYLDDVFEDEELKLSSNDLYFLYGKFLKKLEVDPRKDIEFLLNEGVSYYNISKLFNNSLSGVSGRDFRTMTKTFKRLDAKPHKQKANEEAIKKIITESKMNANIVNAVRLVRFFSKRDANNIVQILLKNSSDCSSTEVEKKIEIPMDVLFKDGLCVLYDRI